MDKDKSEKPGPEKPESSHKEDRILRFQKIRTKIDNFEAPLENELTLEELCSILEKENQEAMSIAVEARDKLLEIRLSLNRNERQPESSGSGTNYQRYRDYRSRNPHTGEQTILMLV